MYTCQDIHRLFIRCGFCRCIGFSSIFSSQTIKQSTNQKLKIKRIEVNVSSMQKLINVYFHCLPLTMSTLNTFHLLSGGLRDTSGNAMTTEITSLNLENKISQEVSVVRLKFIFIQTLTSSLLSFSAGGGFGTYLFMD